MDNLINDNSDLLGKLKDIAIIYTDLDGTMLGKGGALLVDGDGSPSTNTAEALVKVTKANIPVVPVTGRSDFQLVEVTRTCGLNDFIGESGAVISWWTGTDRETHFFLPQWDESILKGRTPIQVMYDIGAAKLLFKHFPGQLEHHLPWNEPRSASEVLRGRIDLVEAQKLLDTLEVPVEINENGAIDPQVHTLDKPKTEHDQIHAYHIVPTGVSKGAAIAEDLKRRGLAKEQALMIGDGMSDLECAPSVGVALMVENARLSPSVVSGIATYDNAAFVEGKKGDGWVQMAELVLAMRG
jgi:hydroxymethylpyrimidine pyrophosphatase-like HAD family hydrolase